MSDLTLLIVTFVTLCTCVIAGFFVGWLSNCPKKPKEKEQ